METNLRYFKTAKEFIFQDGSFLPVLNDCHRVICGDCTKILPWLPDASVNLIFSDLPYGETSHGLDIVIPMQDYVEVKKGRRMVKLNEPDFFLHCYENKIDLVECVRIWSEKRKNGLWTEFNRILAPGGNILLTAQGAFTGYLIESNPKQYKYDLCWNKVLLSGHLNSKRMPMRQHENLLVFNRGVDKSTYNPQQRQRQSIGLKSPFDFCSGVFLHIATNTTLF